jgi:hypothetical protein
MAIKTAMHPCSPLCGKLLNFPPKNCAATQNKAIARTTPAVLTSIAYSINARPRGATAPRSEALVGWTISINISRSGCARYGTARRANRGKRPRSRESALPRGAIA